MDTSTTGQPSASRSGILRPTTPSCSGLFGQRHVDFESVHSAGKKDVNMVQENGFLRSPSCTSRVELTENMEYTANDSDEWTSTDQRAIKKEFEGEWSLCHDACQKKELDRKQDQCSDKEFSRQSRLPTDAVSLKQTHSPGTPRAVGNTWCTRHMAKPRPQVGRVC